MGFLLSIPSAVTLLAAIAAGIALVLFRESITGHALPGCGVTSACHEVTSSRWSRWGPLPVAGPGLGVYVLLVAASILANPLMPVQWQQLGWPALVVLGCVAAGAAVWFIGLQALVIRRMCPYCTAMHGLGLVAAVLVFYEALAMGGSLGGGMPSLGVLITPGIAGLLVLIAGQILIRPRQFIVEKPADPMPAPAEAPAVDPPVVLTPPPPEPVVSPAVAEAPVQPKAPSRVISVFRGKAKLAVDDWPIFGSPQATHIVVDLYDYTCPDCRHVHGLLHQAQERFGEQLAVLAVPVPLEAACNPLVQFHDPRHVNACFYARLSLAMWKIDPAKFAELDRWLYEPDHPPAVAAAMTFARNLAQPAAIEPAMAGAGVEQAIGKAMEFYRASGGGQLPRVLLPDAVLWGRVPTEADLIGVFQQQLKLA